MKNYTPERPNIASLEFVDYVTRKVLAGVGVSWEVYNDAGPKIPGWLTVKNEASADAAEIMIYGMIGKSWYDDSGIADTEFTQALNSIPRGRKVNLRINSQGGSVKDGLAIYNRILDRKADVTCIVDGYACSTASWIALAGNRTIIPENAAMMIHNPSVMVAGDAAELRRAANMLDEHKGAIVAMYKAKTGKGDSEISKAMDEETWFFGQKAKDWGLADEVTSAADIQNNFDLSIFRHVPTEVMNQKPSAAPGSQEQNKRIVMDRARIIALLNAKGIKVKNDATDAELITMLEGLEAAPANTAPPVITPPAPAAPAPAPANADPVAVLNGRIAALEAQNTNERTNRLRTEITALANEGRFPLNSVEAWLPLAIGNETAVMAQLRAMPVNLPGGEPVNAVVELTSEDPHEIDKAVTNLFGKGIHNADTAKERGLKRAQIIAKNFNRIFPVLNAGVNTVSADLKRTVILQQMIRAFTVKVLPLSAFCTNFGGIKLEGTDKVAVPYFPLNTTGSTDFVAANGYDTFADTNSDAKTITVDKRKYQGLKWTSSALARQPFMDIGMGAMLLGDQLGLDVVNDNFSLVTAATFGASVKAEPAAAFDSDDVQDLRGVADLANWPGAGRSLILNSAYDVNLTKDNAVKAAMNFGDSGPIREGRIVRIGGFDYYPDSRVPSPAGENLEGFIAFKSGLLIAFAPVGPTEEVRAQLTRYEVVVEPTTGVTFEYRLWGSADLDTSKQIIEANYGRVAGEAAAIKRITNQ